MTWRGHEPPEPRSGRPDFCGSESGGRKRSGSGGRGASRVVFRKRFRRFVPGDQRALRRLCRTLGLPDIGKSADNRGFCGVTSRTVRLFPDTPGGRVRRRVVGECLPFARLENRSRVARPLSGPVVGRRGKSEKSKLAVSLEPRANRHTGARVNQILTGMATLVPRGADAPLGMYRPRRTRSRRFAIRQNSSPPVRRPYADHACGVASSASVPTASRRDSGLDHRPRPRFGIRRNVPLRSLAAGAASARGGKKPSVCRFCLLVFGKCSPGAR